MSTDTPDLPSNPTAALRTVLKWIADSLSAEDVEAIAYINNLPGTAGQRTALGVLGELEKRGMFSHDNVEPLIRLLSNINRHDIVKNAWMEDFKRQCAVRHGNTNHDSLDTPPPPELHRQADSFDTRSRSPIPPTATIQEPITSSNSRQGTPQPLPPLAHSPPLPSVTKDELLKSLLADPETKSMLISMLQSEQANSNPPPSASQVGEPASILEPDNGRLRNTTSTQPNPGPLPMEMSLSPAELRSAGALHTQSHDAITQTPGNPITSISSVSLSEEEGRLPHQDSQTSQLSLASSISSGIGSIGPTPVHGNPYPRQQLTRSSTPQHQQHKGLPYGVAPPIPSIDEPDDQQLKGSCGKQCNSLPKATLTWRMKREEIGTHIVKHTKKTFTKDFRLKVDGYRSRPVKLVLRVSPNGVGHDRGNAMSLEVLVTVERRYSELKEMAQLRMNVKILIGEEFISVKELNQPLENFTVHDFLPHEIITQTHARHIEMQFEGCLSYDTVSDLNRPRVDSIEYPELDSDDSDQEMSLPKPC